MNKKKSRHICSYIIAASIILGNVTSIGITVSANNNTENASQSKKTQADNNVLEQERRHYDVSYNKEEDFSINITDSAIEISMSPQILSSKKRIIILHNGKYAMETHNGIYYYSLEKKSNSNKKVIYQNNLKIEEGDVVEVYQVSGLPGQKFDIKSGTLLAKDTFKSQSTTEQEKEIPRSQSTTQQEEEIPRSQAPDVDTSYDDPANTLEVQSTGRLAWPFSKDYKITSGFEYRERGGKTEFHAGIDVSAPEGTPILAAEDGIVTNFNNTDDWANGRGKYVEIDHGQGLQTSYFHAINVVVSKGQQVKKGDVIAYVGNTGNSRANHLHLAVMENWKTVDPMKYYTVPYQVKDWMK